MTKTIEEIIKESGWIRNERKNAGKIYVEFTKDGFMIDEDDIMEDKSEP